jgi:hypothetical protein
VPRIRMSEPILPLTLYAYMACTGSNLPLYFVPNIHENAEIKTPCAMIPALCHHSMLNAPATPLLTILSILGSVFNKSLSL